MIKKAFSIAAILLATIAGQAQQKDIREQVYLHQNTSALITGETFFYSAYVTSAATGKASPLSSLLYVELVGEDGKPVFQQKIKLNDGQGSGDFFVSSLIPTGTYQLLAYTRWMKNFNDYYEAAITIINPFEEYKISAAKEQAPAAQFYPEGGVLIANQENMIVMSTDHFNSTELKGKIVNSLGEPVHSFSAQANDLSHFSFTPEAGIKYQLILVDQSGDFFFFELPVAVTNQMGVHLINKRNTYEISALAAPGTDGLTISVRDAQNTIWSGAAMASIPVSFSKSILKAGVYQIVLEQNKKHVASRIFYHPADQTTDQALNTTQHTFEKRSLAEIPFEVPAAGQYSVSVRLTGAALSESDLNQTWTQAIAKPDYAKTDVPADWEKINDLMVTYTTRWSSAIQTDEVQYLPELRGELITGKISLPDTSKAEDVRISYSLLGKDFQIQTSQPDEQGRFVFQIYPMEKNHTAMLRIIQGPESSAISVDDPFLTSYPPFYFAPVVIDSATAARLSARSIRNQIENAYFEKKEDSTLSTPAWMSADGEFGAYDHIYKLDEFNRFTELFQYFIEYIPSVVARKNKTGSRMKVLIETPPADAREPLVLLDGMPVTAQEILDFSPYRIQSIAVISKRYFLGPLISDGVVSLYTYEADLQGFPLPESVLKTSYKGVEPGKAYTFPDYSDASDLSRIPDYREQLYWQPALKTAGKSSSISFYTSDIEGTYEIVVEGFTTDGKPVHLQSSFEVKGTTKL